MDDEGGRRARRPWDRVLRGPSWARALLLRRLAAAVLAVAALVVAAAPDPADERAAVLVAARDLSPGVPLRPADVTVAAWPPGLVPGGALRAVPDVDGRAPAGPVRAGEPLTDLRLIGPELAVRAGGPDASAVPLRPADPAVAALLSAGSRVDVIAGGPEGPRVLAARAGVVAVLPPAPGGVGAGSGPGPLVLVALPEAEATAVAAATLAGEVTVTLR
ncbi:SAF domain-containing protein [Pseudonocardia parietis]|uniref:Flp pilus assembly protein CpaB n=1 Tax=Pseudonocardia parietis TaxID=570936 RepID=A0ABS4W4C2_9PSEU|nr:SAF domain-containing protein [Pseudonocardia parietis]MBP2371029.1 Flp pilus assembly protein CpaB [Pseudonocardia parietis]